MHDKKICNFFAPRMRLIYQYFFICFRKGTILDIFKYPGNLKGVVSFMYILVSDLFEKDDKNVFKARNSCCVKRILAYIFFFRNKSYDYL